MKKPEELTRDEALEMYNFYKRKIAFILEETQDAVRRYYQPVTDKYWKQYMKDW